MDSLAVLFERIVAEVEGVKDDVKLCTEYNGKGPRDSIGAMLDSKAFEAPDEVAWTWMPFLGLEHAQKRHLLGVLSGYGLVLRETIIRKIVIHNRVTFPILPQVIAYIVLNACQ